MSMCVSWAMGSLINVRIAVYTGEQVTEEPEHLPHGFCRHMLCAGLLAGCSGIESRQQADELATMRQDDAYCAGQTTRYPDPAYISCRYQLQNARSYRKWKNAQMVLRTDNVSNQNITNPMF